MPKASGRSLIRSPFPMDQSPSTDAASSSEAPGARGVHDLPLADAITNKQSAISVERSSSRHNPLADIDTRKNPAVSPPLLHRPGTAPSQFNPLMHRSGMLPPAGSVPLHRPGNSSLISKPPQRLSASAPASNPQPQTGTTFPINAAASSSGARPPLMLAPAPYASAQPPVTLVAEPYQGLQRPLPPPMTPPFTRPNVPSPPQKERKRKPRTRKQKVQLLMITALLLLPSCLIIFELISAFTIYKQMQDGIAQLQATESVFHSTSGNSMAAYFNSSKLQQAQTNISAAQTDFASLSDRLDSDGGIALAANLFPAQISTARSLSHIAATGMDAAQQVLKTMQVIAPSIEPALLKNNSTDSTQGIPPTPFLSPDSYQQISTTLNTITPLVHQMANDAQDLSLASLPISSKQRELLASIIPLLPTLDTALPQIYNARDALGWFLGIGGQRTFLVEPMDSSELRATGGFTGQFGELVLNGAHMGSLKLSNIGKYEEDHTAEGSPPDPTIYPKVIGQTPPQPYASWWPIGNFGLRDANLSADFPTSAGIIMNRYQYEFNTSLDGVIVFTPTLIQHVLHVTGPISIPLYKQVITEQNLEDLLHYYQLNNTGIRQEELVEHVQDNQIARKLFTQRVMQALLATVTHLSLDKMLAMASEMFASMKSKDLQMYFTNSQLEALLGKYGSTDSLDRSTSHDGIFIVQSNLSASKASQYVTTSMQDTIVLDNAGGATHKLQLTLDYQQKGDVYGFDTYYDYVRIYAPINSRILSGNGFDQYDKPYCGDAQSGYTLCQADVYGDGTLICTPPVTLGYATAYLHDPYLGKDHPLDIVGPPQNLQSDESGRAMFGGWIVIPKNCTMKVTLSWYVPPQSQQAYHLLFQAQASVYATLDLNIQPSDKLCTQDQGKALHSLQHMDGTDLSFTIKRQGKQCMLVSQ